MRRLAIGFSLLRRLELSSKHLGRRRLRCALPHFVDQNYYPSLDHVPMSITDDRMPR